MDNYRRKPPMEGFSRPGSLSGEAYDDDEVEGHSMSMLRNNTPDDDTEGHGLATPKATDDDTEGHGGKFRGVTGDDDTEGHGGKFRGVTGDDDDTEGHASTRNLR